MSFPTKRKTSFCCRMKNRKSLRTIVFWFHAAVWRLSPVGQQSPSAPQPSASQNTYSQMPPQAPAPSIEDMPAEDEESNDLPF